MDFDSIITQKLIKLKSIMKKQKKQQLAVEAEQLGLSSQEMDIVIKIHRNEVRNIQTTASMLGNYYHVTIPAIMHRLTKMEELGYITKSEDSSDKRTKYIYLNPKIREYCNRAVAAFDLALKRYLDYIGEDDSKAMIRILDKTINYFEGDKND